MKFTIHQIFFHSECCEIKHGRKVVSRTGYIVILTCTVALFRKPNTLFFICFSTSDVHSRKKIILLILQCNIASVESLKLLYICGFE
jgi:hypothetical protein